MNLKRISCTFCCCIRGAAAGRNRTPEGVGDFAWELRLEVKMGGNIFVDSVIAYFLLGRTIFQGLPTLLSSY